MTPFFFTFKGLSNSPIFQYLNFSFHRHFNMSLLHTIYHQYLQTFQFSFSPLFPIAFSDVVDTCNCAFHFTKSSTSVVTIYFDIMLILPAHKLFTVFWNLNITCEQALQLAKDREEGRELFDAPCDTWHLKD